MKYRLDRMQVRMLIDGKDLRNGRVRIGASPELREELKRFDQLDAYEFFDVKYDSDLKTLTIEERTIAA